MKELDTKQTELTPKKVTLKELIERADKIKNRKKETAELFIPSLDGSITIEEPSIDLVVDGQAMEPFEGDKYLVYNCVVSPNLRDKTLQDAYGCVSPMDILKIFKDGEISQIAQKVMILGKFDRSVSVVEKVKN